MKIRMTLDVTYDAAGVSPEVLQGLLQDVAHRASEEGLLSGSTDATVSSYNVSTKVVGEPVTKEAVVALMTDRINNGDLLAEDVPDRLAAYGLMDPVEFSAEMRERIELANEA